MMSALVEISLPTITAVAEPRPCRSNGRAVSRQAEPRYNNGRSRLGFVHDGATPGWCCLSASPDWSDRIRCTLCRLPARGKDLSLGVLPFWQASEISHGLGRFRGLTSFHPARSCPA